MNLYSAFRARWPDLGRPFLRDLHTGVTHRYGDVDRTTSRLAHRLIAEWGVQPGDRIAVQVEKSPESFFLYLACLRAGAVFVPLNTAYQPAEIEAFLVDATPRLFVCDPARLSSPPSLGAAVVTLDERGDGALTQGLDAFSPDWPVVPREDSDLAALCYTSGTTGRSKGATLSHGNLRSNGEAMTSLWGFNPEDRLLHALPTYHVHGLFISLHCALLSGSEVLWLRRFDAATVLRYLPEATVFMGVPTFYTRLLEHPELTRERCGAIRLFVSGSAPLRSETFADFEQRTGHRILERYGMTETGIISSNPLRDERRPGSVGHPLPGVEVRLAEATAEIEVRGPNVFRGYWQQPDKTAADFTPDGFFRTGDLGAFDAQGYLSIVGRAKDLVITGGFNVYPKELEMLIDTLPGVTEAAVFGVPHPDFGEAVVAALVCHAAVEPTVVIEALRQRVAAFKVPKRVFLLAELPRNAMGKVQKNLLREQFGKTFV
jgi:malonyl-CoA/methylmalonyl-CoA synthetase